MTTTTTAQPWLPYVVPFGVYMAFLLGQTDANLPWLYPVKTVVVAISLWWFRKAYVELRPRFSLWAIAVGLGAIAVWIALDPYYPKCSELRYALEALLSRILGWPAPGQPAVPFDPTIIESVTARSVFLGFRVAGAVLVVPVMEELFWRGFLIRWIEAEDFQSVPVGLYTWRSFAVTTALFALEHDQWLAGLVCGALYNWLLYRTRSVWACVVAHAVSNAVLAGWVLARGEWKFW